MLGFCIPVMNRSEDLYLTLSKNIETIEKFKEPIAIYINCFDEDDSLSEWIRTEFSDHIDKGSLIFHKKTMPYWHFSWAKNSFIDDFRHKYYSSLDADNLLSINEIQFLLQQISGSFHGIIHGFQGQFGDGSCGRVTINFSLLRKYQYKNNIYPRQFDELGLISNILANDPLATYVCYEKCNVLKKSLVINEFFSRINIKPNVLEVPRPSGLYKPFNPKSPDYPKRDAVVNFYGLFNQAYQLKNICSSESASNYYASQLMKLYGGLNTHLAEKLVPYTFQYDIMPKKSNSPTLFSVLKNDEFFLKQWIEHYRELGIKRFILIDDHSDKPLSNLFDDEDIFVFKPVIGSFKDCKWFWLKLLILTSQYENSWVVTADADELIDIPKGFENIREYCSALDSSGMTHTTGILLDMLPNINDKEKVLATAENYTKIFSYFWNDRQPFLQKNYSNHKSIQWAFGDYWWISKIFDIRWHLFKTVDSLRKISLFKYTSSNFHLNQGFHDLRFDNKSVVAHQASFNLKSCKFLLPIRHYKFVKVFNNSLASSSVSGYHSRTVENIQKIANTDIQSVVSKLQKINSSIFKYSRNRFMSAISMRTGLYRIIGNDIDEFHGSNQTLLNLKFILENESNPPQVQKIFVLNRILDEQKATEYKNLIKQSGHDYKEIKFSLSDYAGLAYDLKSIPSVEVWFTGKYLSKKNDDNKEIFQMKQADYAIRTSKILYIVNNNGARNFCVLDGKNKFLWTLPFDGNCYLSDYQFTEFSDEICSETNSKYLIFPMERLASAEYLSRFSISKNATEEPQIAFKFSSSETFNPQLPYGIQPKVELLKRLNVKGKWDAWTKYYPWQNEEIHYASEFKSVKKTSNVFRLPSWGNNSYLNSSIRQSTRIKSVVDHIDKIDANCLASSLDFTKAINLILECTDLILFRKIDRFTDEFLNKKLSLEELLRSIEYFYNKDNINAGNEFIYNEPAGRFCFIVLAALSEINIRDFDSFCSKLSFPSSKKSHDIYCNLRKIEKFNSLKKEGFYDVYLRTFLVFLEGISDRRMELVIEANLHLLMLTYYNLENDIELGPKEKWIVSFYLFVSEALGFLNSLNSLSKVLKVNQKINLVSTLLSVPSNTLGLSNKYLIIASDKLYKSKFFNLSEFYSNSFLFLFGSNN